MAVVATDVTTVFTRTGRPPRQSLLTPSENGPARHDHVGVPDRATKRNAARSDHD